MWLWLCPLSVRSRIFYPVFIQICFLGFGHSWRMWLAKQETLNPPGHLVSPLVFDWNQGFLNAYYEKSNTSFLDRIFKQNGPLLKQFTNKLQKKKTQSDSLEKNCLYHTKELMHERRCIKRRGKRSDAAVWLTPLNDRQCIGEMTQRRYKYVRLYDHYGPT